MKLEKYLVAEALRKTAALNVSQTLSRTANKNVKHLQARI